MPSEKHLNKLLLTTFLCLVYPVLCLHAEKQPDPDHKLTGTEIRTEKWVGLDLGTPHVIKRVGWKLLNDDADPESIVLGLFEGSNREDFVDAIPLYMITEEGTVGAMSYANVLVSRGFRYVRWCAPSGSQSDVCELEFYGHVVSLRSIPEATLSH